MIPTPVETGSDRAAFAVTGRRSGIGSRTPGPVSDQRRIDVVVRPSGSLDPATRPFRVVSQRWGGMDVPLPRVSLAVIPDRFLLRDGESAAHDVTVDRGEGPEDWRITVSRRTEKRP